MGLFTSILTFFSRYTKRLSICANVGLMCGGIVGLLLSFLSTISDVNTPNLTTKLYISLMLTGFTWLTLILIFFLFTNYKIKIVILPIFFNCLVTSLLTVFAVFQFNFFSWGWLIGIFIGILAGTLLCYIKKIIN